MHFGDSQTSVFAGSYFRRTSGSNIDHLMTVTKISANSISIPWNFAIVITLSNSVANVDFGVRQIGFLSSGGVDYVSGCGIYTNTGSSALYMFNLKVLIQ